MQAIEFHKDRARYLLDCLEKGEPIAPSPEGWRHYDMLLLAGACLFGASTHGPTFPQPDLSSTQEELSEEDFVEDLIGTIEWLAQIVTLVQDDEYDENFEPVMRAIVYGGTHKVVPVEGWKNVL